MYIKLKGNIKNDDLSQCNDLQYGRYGVIDFIVDDETFLVIDTDTFEYEDITTENTIQIEYITPELKQKDITCYININWAKSGDELISQTIVDNYTDSSNVVWKVLIVICIILLFVVVMERIYFYAVIYKKLQKYMKSDIDKEDDDISDDMDPVQLFENKQHGVRTKKGGYQQTRSFSVSGASYNNNIGYSPSWSRSGSGDNNNKKHFVATLPPNLGVNMSRSRHRNGNDGKVHKKQGRAMSMQISSYPFTRPPTKEDFLQQRKRKNSESKSQTESLDEIAPLSINGNIKQKRKQRIMSLPNNLMSENTLKKRERDKLNDKRNSLWINDYDDADFWKKELRVLKEAGFENKKQNLSMLLKYAVRNEDEIIDKKMTKSIVLRILQKKKTEKKKQKKEAKNNQETENFLENEWEDNDDDDNDDDDNDDDDNNERVKEKDDDVVNVEKDMSITPASDRINVDQQNNNDSDGNVYV